MNDPSLAYRPTARFFHWTVAVLVIATLPVGQTMIQEGLPRDVQDALFIFHKNVGVLILLLVLFRIVYRVANPPPPLPSSVPGWQQAIAKTTHVLLYLFLLVMAVSGYVRVVAGGFPLEVFDALGAPRLAPRSDSLAETAKTVHFYARYALVALIIAHVGAALFHGLVKRDGVFSRMWPAAGSRGVET